MSPFDAQSKWKEIIERHATPEFLITLHQYQEQGFLPEALLNFVALVGRNPGGEKEIFSIEELIQLFSLDRVVKSNAVYMISIVHSGLIVNICLILTT